MEEYYTVKNIETMTGLSERTIRRYIKNKSLLGYKVGGEWRFSNEQVKNLFKEQDFSKNLGKQASLDAKRFINGEYETDSKISICSIIDFKNSSNDELDLIKNTLGKLSNEVTSKFSMKLVGDEQKLRITLIGNLKTVSNILDKLGGFE